MKMANKEKKPTAKAAKPKKKQEKIDPNLPASYYMKPKKYKANGRTEVPDI